MWKFCTNVTENDRPEPIDGKKIYNLPIGKVAGEPPKIAKTNLLNDPNKEIFAHAITVKNRQKRRRKKIR